MKTNKFLAYTYSSIDTPNNKYHKYILEKASSNHIFEKNTKPGGFAEKDEPSKTTKKTWKHILRVQLGWLPAPS